MLEAWKPLKKSLLSSGHSIIAVPINLIDLVWDDQPPPPLNPLLTLSEKYTGRAYLNYSPCQRIKQVGPELLILSEKYTGMTLAPNTDREIRLESQRNTVVFKLCM